VDTISSRKRNNQSDTYTKDAESKILAEVISAGTGGILRRQILQNIPGLDRTTLTRNAKKLWQDKKIRVQKEGKNIKYIVMISNAYLDVQNVGYLLAARVMTHILGKFVRNIDTLILPEGSEINYSNRVL
jgi:hypothetical protein